MTNSPEGAGGARPVKERLREELRRYLVVSAYLYVCFGAIELFKTAVLRDAGVAYLPLGVAAGKALILGKFLLIGEAAGVGTRGPTRTLLQRIVRRVVLLFAVLLALVALEEVLVGWMHGRTFAQTAAEFGDRLPEALASAVLVLLVIVPLVALTELGRALGPGTLARVLAAPPGERVQAVPGDEGAQDRTGDRGGARR